MKTVSSISTVGVWSCPATTGDRPLPCDGLTFTTVDDRRAVLFGGYNKEQGDMNDVFIIDLSTMVLVSVHMCVLGGGSCQLPPRGEPLYTHNTMCVAKADNHLCESCGVVQTTRVVKLLVYANYSIREMAGVALQCMGTEVLTPSFVCKLPCGMYI